MIEKLYPHPIPWYVADDPREYDSALDRATGEFFQTLTIVTWEDSHVLPVDGLYLVCVEKHRESIYAIVTGRGLETGYCTRSSAPGAGEKILLDPDPLS